MSLFELLFALIHLFMAISFAKFIYFFYGFIGSFFAFISALWIIYYLGIVIIGGMFDYIDSLSPKIKKRNRQLEKLVIYAFMGYLFFVEIILIVGFLKILWLEYKYRI